MVAAMTLRDSIDDLDVLIAELTELRQELSHADLRGADEEALWSVEAGLRQVAARASTRATVVRQAIDLFNKHRVA
jgi:prefoldin subunit 5